ncbi:MULTISPECIES: hypothetical protein [Leptospira]|uniref:Uncharacterized protein n=2 Tax=Leptospira interrogans TaxID=173 RepID=A0A0E2D9I4_LEPIR|nr:MULTISPECIES: hypothetical protein [Leptospira]EKR56531.1 hypothetical protein LEP1GSC105_4238 [Leptospira interrogans str. UI 12758]EMJ34086.1 hypothetical protein LEP1GSC079_5188 [Leptospira interrogans str. FPW1039]EMN92986.1 hypothetical protein LEP1GSC110_0257 [Leptospira interrogans serovar Medanensis str. UT053]
MSFLNSTNQTVLEPVSYKKEQEIKIQKPLEGTDTFFVKDKDGEILYVSRYDAIRILDRQRIFKYPKSEKDNGR